MLTSYIEAAMRRAKYQELEDEEGYAGEIQGVEGPWASAPTKDECREELRSVLEDWILIKLRHNDNDFPVIDGLDLNLPETKQEVA